MSKNLFLPNLSPIRIISTGSFTGLLLIAYITWIALQQPWLGIQIQYQPGESTLKIIKVLKNSPAYNILNPGDEIVASHLKSIYRKLNISSRAEATLEALRLGLINNN